MKVKIAILLCLLAAFATGSLCAQFNRNLRLYEVQQSEYNYITHTYFYYHGDHTYELDSLITIAVNPNTQASYTKHRWIYHYSDERLEQMEHWSTSFVNMETWYNRYDYIYNPQGNLTSVTEYYRFPDNPTLYLGFLKYFIYGTIGGQPCLQNIVYHDFEPPRPIERTTFYYHNTVHGYRLRDYETWAAWDSTNWEPSSQYSYFYIPADTSNTETLLDGQLKSALWQYEVPGMNYLSKGFLDHSNSYTAVGWPSDAWNWNLVGSTVYTYNDSNQLIHVQTPMNVFYTFSWGDNGYPATCNFFGSSGYTEQYSYVWGPDTASEDPILPLPTALSLNAFPNPFTENVSITTNDKKKQPVKGSIYNLKGERVLAFTFSGDDRFAWYGINQKGEHLPSGIYLVRVNTNEQSSTRRIILLK